MFDADNITYVAEVKGIMHHVVLSMSQASSILMFVHHAPGHLTHHSLGVVLADDQGLDGASWEHQEVEHLGDHDVFNC